MKSPGSLLNRWRLPPVQEIMGHRIEEPRLTAMAWWWGMLYVGLPLLGAGMLVDAAIQSITGQCTGVWCWF
jgi:hypothetical protein